ncbi:MAG TPA: hypothetical protein VGR37_01925 [Longimicrobiaceae bacterium]|nr:hypothetical protein [Longimicrobiaceae bacterium]
MRSLATRRSAILCTACAAAVLLTACDPVYRVGARQALIGTEVLSPKEVPPDSPSQPDSVPARLDIPRVGDCLEAALHASPTISEVQRWSVPRYLRWRQAGMSFALVGSSAPGGRQYANLELDARPREPPLLQVSFTWIGSARSEPIEVQRQMVAAATELLVQLTAQCVPSASGPIECVAEGLGGRGACATGR